MKKWLLPMLLISAMAPTASACSPDNGPEKGDLAPAPDPQPNPDPEPAGGRCLVVCFSCTGTTEGVAGQIAEITGGDLRRIRPKEPYTAADLDYRTDCRANREQNDPSARPAIDGEVENMPGYDVVFLGYPIWWGSAPKIVSTFLESYDFAGKTLVPFCTSHSSGIGSSDTDLHALASQATWKRGKRFSGKESKEELENWVESMSLAIGGAGGFPPAGAQNGQAAKAE